MSGISSKLLDERQTRAVISDLDRRVRSSENNDVLIDASRRLIMRSPSGRFWALAVSDAGVLSAVDMGLTL